AVRCARTSPLANDILWGGKRCWPCFECAGARLSAHRVGRTWHGDPCGLRATGGLREDLRNQPRSKTTGREPVYLRSRLRRTSGNRFRRRPSFFGERATTWVRSAVAGRVQQRRDSGSPVNARGV